MKRKFIMILAVFVLLMNNSRIVSIFASGENGFDEVPAHNFSINMCVYHTLMPMGDEMTPIGCLHYMDYNVVRCSKCPYRTYSSRQFIREVHVSQVIYIDEQGKQVTKCLRCGIIITQF